MNFSLNPFFNLLYKKSKNRWESIFRLSKMDKNKCPKMESQKYFAQNARHCDHN
jgi:hypothetical protein